MLHIREVHKPLFFGKRSHFVIDLDFCLNVLIITFCLYVDVCYTCFLYIYLI